MVAALGTDGFRATLLRSVRRLIDFDFLMAFAYHGTGMPLALGDTLPAPRRAVIISAYCTAPYLLDPFFQKIAAGVQSGCYRLRDIAPDRFRQSEYFRTHYGLTGIREEVGFYFPLACDLTGVLSLARWGECPTLARSDMDLLQALEPAISALCSRNWESAAAKPVTAERARPRGGGVSAAYTEFGARHLSERERQIVSLILQGHSTGSVAHLLDISAGTVKVHRKNIYRKLGLSTQAELFAAFLSFVG